MKRLALWIGVVLTVFSLLVCAHSPSPKPDPELKKLGVPVGHWTYEGEYKAGPGGSNGKAKGEDRIQWILDGYFLQEQLAETGPMGETRSILIYGYDPANKNITWSGRGSDGGGGSGTIKVNGNTIKNLGHLVEVLRDCGEELITFEFDLRGAETIVLSRKEVLAATEEILNDNGLRAQGSPDMLALWNAKP